MKMGKKIFMLLLTSALFCSSMFATQISFQILQKDETCDEINDKSYDIETFVLDGFFDRNFIVTTSQSCVFEDEEDCSSLWKSGMGEAFEGSSDYFVQIEVFYKVDESGRKPQGMIDKISWKLANVRTGIIMDSQTVTDIIKKANGAEDLGAISLNLVKNINKSIKA